MTWAAVKDAVVHGGTATWAAIAPAFLHDTLEHMVPWLIASGCVIVCDLAFGIRKSLMMNEEVRFSTAMRRPMGKMVTYFAFVCMVCAVEVAAGSEFGIDKWSCLFVCFLEFCSIVSNILKPKGYTFNVKKLFALLAGKALRTEKEELEGILEQSTEGKDTKKGQP